MRPLRCGGALVTRITIHPKIEPIMNVMRILIGINHLHTQPNSLQNTRIVTLKKGIEFFSSELWQRLNGLIEFEITS